MKELYIVRHAKSSWDHPDLDDIDRPLNGRGRADAPVMGERLKSKGVIPGLMLSSPATRALATCVEIASVLGYPKDKIRTDRRLYHADEDQLLMVIRGLDDSITVAMIFGHNPGLTGFANLLLDDSIDNIPTAGVVAVTSGIQRWRELHKGGAHLGFFDYPKRK